MKRMIKSNTHSEKSVSYVPFQAGSKMERQAVVKVMSLTLGVCFFSTRTPSPLIFSLVSKLLSSTGRDILHTNNYQSAKVEDEIQWKLVHWGHQTPPSCSLHQAVSSVSLHSLGQQVHGCQISSYAYM